MLREIVLILLTLALVFGPITYFVHGYALNMRNQMTMSTPRG